MERTYINEAQKAIGGTVKVQGFIENLRNSKYMAFIVLKDITGKLQITVEKADHPRAGGYHRPAHPGLCHHRYRQGDGERLRQDGRRGDDPREHRGGEHRQCTAHRPQGDRSHQEKKKAVERSSIDQRIDYRWIDLRTDENQLMFKAQSCFVNAMRKFLLDRNFIEIHTPKLIAAASESGSEVFKVDYFDRNAYLAQSPPVL